MHQQFEGESLEQLVLEVKNKWGSQAKIVKAEKIKPKGFKSLGVKNKYCLHVEVPDVIDLTRNEPPDRFKIDRATHRENELVRDPAAMAKRLAMAYGEEKGGLQSSPPVDQIYDKLILTNLSIEDSQVVDPLAQNVQDVRADSKRNRPTHPSWKTLGRDTVKILKPAPKSKREKGRKEEARNAYSSNNQITNSVNLNAPNDSFINELTDAQANTDQTLANSEFENELIKLATRVKIQQSDKVDDMRIEMDLEITAVLNLDCPSSIDLTRNPPEISWVEYQQLEPNLAYSNENDSPSSLDKINTIDHLSRLEDRIEELIASLSREVQADILAVNDNCEKTSKDVPNRAKSTRAHVLVIGESHLINEGLHYLYNVSGELGRDTTDHEALIIETKSGLEEFNKTLCTNAQPKLAIAPLSTSSSLSLEDFRSIRKSHQDLQTYFVLDHQIELFEIDNCVTATGGPEKVSLILCGNQFSSQKGSGSTPAVSPRSGSAVKTKYRVLNSTASMVRSQWSH